MNYSTSALRTSDTPLLKRTFLFFPPGKTFTGHRLIEKLVQVEIFADAMAKVKEAQRSSSITEAVK